VALATLLTLTACAPATAIKSARPLGEIQPPTFQLVPGQTSIERFDPPGAGAGFAMTVGTLVRNPNEFPVRLVSVEYTVLLQGEVVSKGSMRPALYLEAGATAPLRFPIHSDLKGKGGLLRAVVRAFADTPLPFRVEGTLRFSSSSYSFETRKSVLVSGATLARQTVAPPRLRLDEAASRAFTLRAGVPVVQVVVKATNPGDIGYFLYGKDLDLTLAGQSVAREDMRPVPLAAGQDGRIDLVFYPDPRKLSADADAALQAALQGIPTLLRVKGTLTMDVLGVDSFTVPPEWEIAGFVSAPSSTH
jgi:hypothetical protein